MTDRRRLARGLLPLVDLAAASGDAAEVARVVAAARTRFGPVAAVGVPPPALALAREGLRHSGVALAALADDAAGIAQAARDGADEIEVAFPHDAFAADAAHAAGALAEFARAARRASGRRPLLKVMIEPGRLSDAAAIRPAAALAIEGGADLVGIAGRSPGVSLAAAEAVLAAIAAARAGRRWVGLKLGGLPGLAAAEPLLHLATARLGEAFAGTAGLRVEGATLLEEIEALLAA